MSSYFPKETPGAGTFPADRTAIRPI